MRVKDQSSYHGPEKVRRCRRANRPPDEDSSDDIVGLTCHHVGQAVDVNQVKRAVAQNVWSTCLDCIKERRMKDGEPSAPADVWLCLKCGHQGCSANSEYGHALKHFQTTHSESHCIAVNLSTWIICCYECDEELSTHCNKKALAQMLDYLQKHSSRSGKGCSSRVICLREQDIENPKNRTTQNSTFVPVKGITNLGNTCFFNAVMQNLAHTHMLTEALAQMKEKDTKLKIDPNEENLDPLLIDLPSPGPLTSAVVLFLHSIKQESKDPVSPKILFSQLCQKAPRFKTFQQQDSQELLHYLLDALRIEETKRTQSGILKAFNNPTTKTADEDTKRKVKAYGREGVKMNFIDRVFVGELTSTVMCEECENISSVKEAFIDLSLPIVEERVSKPAIYGKGSKAKNHEDDSDLYNCNNSVSGAVLRKPCTIKENDQWQQGHQPPEASISNGSNDIMQDNSKLSEEGTNNNVSKAIKTGSQSEGSERNGGIQLESSGDADSEDSEYENSSEINRENNDHQNNVTAENHPAISDFLHSSLDAITGPLSKLSLNPMEENLNSSKEEPRSHPKCVLSQNPQTAFLTLSNGYVTSSKECSVQSCLYQFTSVELLMGNNKLLCETCTENRMQYQRKTNSTEEKKCGIYTNARKQLLISAVPANLILHLKRFCQSGLTLRKINRHVDFPFILNLAPFCSAVCKNVLEETSVLYSLYGIVEHSGSMKGGHYVAYVKIRIPSKRPVPKDGATSSSQWVYVSDTHVQMVAESRVLSAQAYLLFYERL